LKEKMNPKPILSLVPIESIRTPIYGLADKSNNDITYSYIFLPPRKMWPDVFAKMMKDKVGKKKSRINFFIFFKSNKKIILKSTSKN